MIVRSAGAGARSTRAGLACSALVLACVSASPGIARAVAPQEGLRTDFVTGTSPYAVAFADLDRTHQPDMVVANFASASVSVFLDDGPGKFHLRRDQATGTSPRAVAVGDVNGDGLYDIVTANAGGNSVSVLMGAPGAAFVFHVDYATGRGPRSLALADLNGDGMLDIAAADYFGGTASVLLNDGHGQFLPRTAYVSGTEPSGIVVADVNGDGRPDLLVANGASNSVSVLLGNGRGGFAPRTNYLTGRSPIALAVGDLNGDGLIDCATADYVADTISVLLNDGQGGFQLRVDTPTGSGPASIAIADVDGDGQADIVTANGRNDTVTLLPGNGAGGFGAPTAFVTGAVPVFIALEDLNDDGRRDIITANSNGRSVSVNFGTYKGAFPPGAAAAFPAGEGPSGLAVGDIDGDGLPDIALTSYLSDRVTVYHDGGDGSFATHLDLPTGRGPLAVAIGNLDYDKKPDLVVANTLDSTVSVYIADSRYGGFRDRVDYPVLGHPCSVAIGDVVGDELPDLVVVNQGSDLVSVLMGTGAGTFGARTDWVTGSSPRSVAIADMNSDGLNDLVVSDFNSRTVSILLNNHSVGFVPRTGWQDPGMNPEGVAVADVNGDHYPDVVVANPGSNSVSVIIGDGAGGYRTGVDLAAGRGARSVAVSDLNDDGNVDLVVANEQDNTISVLLGDGRGGFATHSDVPVGAGPWEVCAFDPDGKLGGDHDVAVADQRAGTLTILAPRPLTLTALVSQPERSVPGETVTLTATVTPTVSSPVPPTGSVRFFDGTTLLGSAPLQGGSARMASPPLALGLRTLSAAYQGDARYRPSLAPGVVHRVFRCGLTLTASAAPETAFEATTVVIDGAGYPGITSVRFGGVPSPFWTVQPTNFGVDSARIRIRATVPLGALSGSVKIDCPCGSATSPEVVEVRKTFTIADKDTKHNGWLLGIGWPASRSLADTLGFPLADLVLPGRSDVDWRVRRWDARLQNYVGVERLQNGVGYWIQTRNPWRVQLTGTATRETPQVLPLTYPGWYLFGNPYSHAVSAADLRVLKRGIARPIEAQTDVQSTIYVWNENSGRFSPTASIPPGGVFWVLRLSLTTAETLLVNPPSIEAPGAGAPGQAIPLDWSVRLSAWQPGGSADTVTLGSAPFAVDATHPLSARVPPASPFAQVSLAARAPDGEGAIASWQRLVQDRAHATQWSLLIEHAEAPGEVRLSLVDAPPAGFACVLSDSAAGYSAALETGREISLAALAPGRRLRLELVPADAPPRAAAVERIRAYPSPFRGTTGFWFSHAAQADVRVSLFDVAGREVRVLERRNAPAGENVLVWDGRDAHGTPAPAAVYFARCELGAHREVLRLVRVR